ncbi:putative GDP-fucose protein O-fucosyltransferase [Helianthus debilis subsp. tardiflorus]
MKSSHKEPEESKGFVTFSLTNGPEYHVSQITDAVVVARYLKATLVIPDIRGSQPGDWRLSNYVSSGNFGDIYDIEKFVSSLDGVVKVVKSQPSELSTKDLAVLRIPNRVTKEYIANNIEPVFKTKGNVRLATYFPSVNMRRTRTPENEERHSVCLAMFGSLELQPEVREVVDSIVERLKTLSRKSDSEFVVVDLRLDMLDQKGCQGSKNCYGPDEIALFLKKLGFDSLKKCGLFDAIEKFLGSDSSEYEKVIDFYVCSESDVFMPAISGLFYANVAGKRIGSRKTKIVVPDDSASAGSELGNYISRYVLMKTHMAYSCFC